MLFGFDNFNPRFKLGKILRKTFRADDGAFVQAAQDDFGHVAGFGSN
jgi:hypothetical protein